MGYELPATLGVRLAQGDVGEVIALIGDGTFLMQPTELATAAQEGLKVTVVVSDNHGYQVIRRLQMHASGRHFGNEMRYRVGSLGAGPLEGDYVRLDLVSVARGLGATVFAAATRDEVLRRPRPRARDRRAGRHRRADGAAREPAALRRVVGRRARRCVLTAVAGGEARRPTRQAWRPSGGTDERRCATGCAPASRRSGRSSTSARRSRPRRARSPASTGC